MLRSFYFIVFLLISVQSFGGNEGILGAKSYGLGGNSILLRDVWSSSNNPSQISRVKGFQAGINYGNQFIIKELATKSIAASYGKNNSGFGLSFNQFGYSIYNENTLGLSYGMQLSDKFRVGVQLTYLNTRIANDYGSASGISATIGLSTQLTENLEFATVLTNPNRLKLASYQDERYPTLLKLGLAYNYSKKVQLLTEYVKDIDEDGDFRIGLDYQFNNHFSFQTGYSTVPASFSFGFGINYSNLNIQLASAYDQYLGFSPQISLVFIADKIKNEN